ncbi:hypothetical protein VE03_01455 [Pseudogymnoascus sp. 23342-1-I1]|nr:hypothetical protein VE03_01455 [Pseudogymnoascus sp. 23342-1-I1]
MSFQTNPTLGVGDHEAFMEFALIQAQKSPPAGNKFCVGAILVDADNRKCCFIKIADEHNLPEERIHEVLPVNTVLYTTMEPCNERLSGNMTCATRILRLKSAIRTVYVGIKEPGTFIARNDGQQRLEANGVKVVFPVEHWRDKITKVSIADTKG